MDIFCYVNDYKIKLHCKKKVWSLIWHIVGIGGTTQAYNKFLHDAHYACIEIATRKHAINHVEIYLFNTILCQ